MYYPCSENKDADQLRGYREADLRLCFRPCKLLVFSRTGSSCLFKKSQSNKFSKLLLEPPREKTNNVVSEQVRHKPTCTSIEKS